ncbi:hypothetical protein N7539_005314 [Penicillium diatomitis]|uniref:Uncharacterized protein n=1 Tax=Penicillium diatomitis TaxID=2819901 RepID=A0A9X0BUY7_9EURO|nr:uncharacterized protein N7539_005314 [Penicillium diatomitis]KAJ5485326.1 hypothetical protein N7539_005314 [Penicillium diatomitis]
MASMKNINPSSQTFFLQSDISLLKNVDKACAEIAPREQKVNLLFMTPGVMTMKGRQETAEGLDRKFVLHYYARMRFIYKLLPLLRRLHNRGPRVMALGYRGSSRYSTPWLRFVLAAQACLTSPT